MARFSCINRTAGTASSIIEGFRIREGDKVILVLRVSSCVQHRSKNLRDQERRLRQAVKKAGGVVIGVVHPGKGFGPGYETDWLWKHAIRAQRTGAILLAESTSRFVRNRFYHSEHRPELRATDSNLRMLRIDTLGVRLMTLIDPDAKFEQERSEQIKRGLWAKAPSRKSAPGAKKTRREKLLARVKELSELGWSSRDIENETHVPKTTVNRWLAHF